MTTETLRPEKMALIVARRIVNDVQREKKSVGDKLAPEKDMLERYGIGRGTLREALRYLEFQGLIALKSGPGGGPVIQQLDSSGLEQSISLLLQVENAPYRTVAEARAGFEPMMARLAAERMSGAEVDALVRNVDEMAAAIDDEERFLELNRQFHRMIAYGSGNIFFGHLVEAITGIMAGSPGGTDYPPSRRQASFEAHCKILEGIRGRNPDAAAASMNHHIETYGTHINANFPERLDAPIMWGSR